MAKTKTFKTNQDVTEFINSVADEKKRADSFKLIETMSGVTVFAIQICYYQSKFID
jgi:hypothetical protein